MSAQRRNETTYLKGVGEGTEQDPFIQTFALGGAATGSVSAFGDILTAGLTPIVQLESAYNINTERFITHLDGGTVTVADSMASVSTGAAANQGAVLCSRRQVTYNTGQGGLFRGTAIFSAGVADSEQLVGIGNAFDGYFFGFNGATFGVLRRTSGVPEIQTLTVTTKSSTAENITITLNGDADATVAVTNGATIATTANEIAAHDYSAVGDGWDAYAAGDTVIFVSRSAGPKSGAYTLSVATTAVGTFAQSLAGVAVSDTWVPQTSWNVDTMISGQLNPSGQTLSVATGNVYQIKYQWLGFGMISFYIENGSTGELQLVHQISYANANTLPSIQNPTLPICVSAKNAANTSDIVIKTSSLAGFCEGYVIDDGVIGYAEGSELSLTTTETPILSVRNKPIYQSKQNRLEAKFLDVTLTTNAVSAVTFRVYRDSTLEATTWTDVNANTSAMQYDTAATTHTAGRLMYTVSLKTDDRAKVPVEVLEVLLPGESYTITAEAASGTTSDVFVTAGWKEI